MSKQNRSTKLGANAVVCHNPFCTRQQKAFTNNSAFQKHLAVTPQCQIFLQNHNEREFHMHTAKAPMQLRTVAPHVFQVSNAIIDSSKKRKCLLRRDVVNVLKEQEPMTNPFVNVLENNTQVEPQPDIVDHTADWENDADATDDDAMHPDAFVHTTDQKWTVSLLKILDDMHAPDYAFEQVLGWARDARAAGFSFRPPGGLSRSKQIDRLYDLIPEARQLLPSRAPLSFADGSVGDVIVFDFVPQLLNLLQNPKIMIQENLVIDVNNPLTPYADADKRLGEALSGSVYKEAYDRFITQPQKELFVPIIQWIDRTSVSGNDRFSLKPYMFTPAIFTEPFRRTIKAWGYHGFLPKVKLSSAQNQMQQQGVPIRKYHKQLGKVLETFRTANERLRNITLPLGPTKNICVNVVTCILFVIQDMQEGDMLCGRYGNHAKGIQRHCRACDVNYENLDNTKIQCTYLESDFMHDIAINANDDTRKRWSQHRVENAFRDVPMADPLRGILGSSPVDTMHCFRKGMIEQVTFLVLTNVPVSKKAALDRLAIQFHKRHRQTYRKQYPSTDFSNGITNLTKISASERNGLVFLFVILFQYEEGWAILDDALYSRDRNATLASVLQLFEGMLCFDAWLNLPIYWKLEDTEEARASLLFSLRKLMTWCTERIPQREEGQKWNFPKFHELLHIVDDMIRFGSSINFSAQRPESLLINAAKHPGRAAQMRHEGVKYELQAAQRLAYTGLINEVHLRIWPTSNTEHETHNPDAVIAESTGNATFCTITRLSQMTNPNTYTFRLQWATQTNPALMTIPVPLLEFVCHEFGNTVRVCTEFKRDVHTFRCHPCYQSDGPIYDWMLVDFEGYATPCPCRLSAVVLNDAFDTTNPDSKPFQLIVQSTLERVETKSSVLLKQWTWSPTYLVIDTDSIVSPSFVISIVDDDSVVLEALALDAWPGQFTTMFD